LVPQLLVYLMHFAKLKQITNRCYSKFMVVLADSNWLQLVGWISWPSNRPVNEYETVTIMGLPELDPKGLAMETVGFAFKNLDY